VSGPDSDESVPHVHPHVIPRWKVEASTRGSRLSRATLSLEEA